MSWVVYVIRHGASEGNRYNQASFGPKGGALTEKGIEEAKTLSKELQAIDIDTRIEPAATSAMKRAYETAHYAGFQHINIYSVLNEVGGDEPPEILDAMLARKEAPPSAIAAAQKLLKNPPLERVWVTHGQLIAGIAHVLHIPTSELFIPKTGTITKLELP